MGSELPNWMLNPLMMYSALFLSQIGNSYFRSWNIKAIAKKDYLQAHFSWFLYGVMFLTSMTIGIKSVLTLDFIGISIWFIGSHLGLWLGMISKKEKC